MANYLQTKGRGRSYSTPDTDPLGVLFSKRPKPNPADQPLNEMFYNIPGKIGSFVSNLPRNILGGMSKTEMAMGQRSEPYDKNAFLGIGSSRPALEAQKLLDFIPNKLSLQSILNYPETQRIKEQKRLPLIYQKKFEESLTPTAKAYLKDTPIGYSSRYSLKDTETSDLPRIIKFSPEKFNEMNSDPGSTSYNLSKSLLKVIPKAPFYNQENFLKDFENIREDNYDFYMDTIDKVMADYNAGEISAEEIPNQLYIEAGANGGQDILSSPIGIYYRNYYKGGEI